MKNSTVRNTLIKFLGSLILSLPVYSQADFLTLDNGFGVDGHLAYVGDVDNSIYNIGVEVLSDGRIITLSSFDSAGLISQFLDDGTLDSSFGSNGDIYLNDTRLSDLTVQPDGKIVVVGQANISLDENNLLVARYLSNGMPDNSFGNNGKTIILNQFSNSNVSGVDIQSDGGIVISGGSEDIQVAKITNNGMPDLAFGISGTNKVISDFGGRGELSFDMAIDDQDRILVTGVSFKSPTSQELYDTRVIVVRYLPNGQLDYSFKDVKFGNFGYLCDFQKSCGKQYIYAEDDQAFHIYPKQLVIKKANGDNLDGNKILITGKFGTARLAEDGTFDHSFGSKGMVYDYLPQNHVPESLAVRNDGKIIFLLGKNKTTNSNMTSELSLYKANGQLDDDILSNDCVFDPSVNIDFQNYTIGGVSGLKLDSNDRVIIAGNGNEASQTDLNSAFLARYKYSKCSKSLKYRDYYEYNPFVHPLDEFGPIWGGLNNTTTNKTFR